MEIYGPKSWLGQILEPLSFNNPSWLIKILWPKIIDLEGFYYIRFRMLNVMINLVDDVHICLLYDWI